MGVRKNEEKKRYFRFLNELVPGPVTLGFAL